MEGRSIKRGYGCRRMCARVGVGEGVCKVSGFSNLHRCFLDSLVRSPGMNGNRLLWRAVFPDILHYPGTILYHGYTIYILYYIRCYYPTTTTLYYQEDLGSNFHTHWLSQRRGFGTIISRVAYGRVSGMAAASRRIGATTGGSKQSPPWGSDVIGGKEGSKKNLREIRK